MFKLDVVQIIFSLINILLMGFFLFKEYSAKKKTGKTIVKRRNLLLMIFVVAIVVILIGILDYSDTQGLIFLDIIHILFMVICSRQMFSICSSKFYTIHENGICVDFATFLKWEEINGYEWDHDFLKLKISKQGVIRKIKIEKENIKEIQDILEKNDVLVII